eukprot:jgi/Botrbrau1/7010/Bobra.0165s0039.1
MWTGVVKLLLRGLCDFIQARVGLTSLLVNEMRAPCHCPGCAATFDGDLIGGLQPLVGRCMGGLVVGQDTFDGSSMG